MAELNLASNHPTKRVRPNRLDVVWILLTGALLCSSCAGSPYTGAQGFGGFRRAVKARIQSGSTRLESERFLDEIGLEWSYHEFNEHSSRPTPAYVAILRDREPFWQIVREAWQVRIELGADDLVSRVAVYKVFTGL